MSESVTESVNPANPEKSLSLNEQAYLAFRYRLTTLRYKPGEYLNTAQVMDDLEMGRTPINQAIHRLATEGLLQIIPRKGVMVAPLSIDDALELIEVRLVNETLCAELASQKASESHIQQLRDLNQQIALAGKSRNREKMMLLDREFHQVLADIAGNRRLSDILSVIHAQTQRFWATTLSNRDHIDEVIDEHNEIINALASGDKQHAASATQAHIFSFKRALILT
ncbi:MULTISPECIES: GntR family transcriptional regulator [Pantoea]|uniref:GntR family transcriptional regulator n=1 Tax=Candidatus Pantoea multigeneris TaxID=2608357 RepID=A0ABX0RBN6_9GAMM|nr:MULTISPECIES: GntR family transcriptional regulator [Pantoea]NIF22776.1 GntR family transcriptional regulator [Pantoea multigeneris]